MVRLCQRALDNSALSQIHGDNINFDIEAKNQRHPELMNVCDTLSHSDTLMCLIWFDYMYVKGEKSCVHKTKPCKKLCKEVGSQMAKLALWLIKFIKYGIVQFLLYDYLGLSPNCVYIPNIHC